MYLKKPADYYSIRINPQQKMQQVKSALFYSILQHTVLLNCTDTTEVYFH